MMYNQEGRIKIVAIYFRNIECAIAKAHKGIFACRLKVENIYLEKVA